MADISSFIKKWDGRTLQDDGCVVSREYKSFQTAFGNAMKKIAQSLGAEVVNYDKGHYDMSGFIKRGDRYVYFSYDSSLSGSRSKVILRGKGFGCCAPLLLRTAANAKDFHGGTNNYESVKDCEKLIDKLLNTEHKRNW